MAKTVVQQEINSFDELSGIFSDIEQQYSAATYQKELQASETVIAEMHQGFFDRQQDPFGTPWKDISAATKARKGHDRILIDTERLIGSLTEIGHPDHVGSVTDRELEFGTSVEYSPFQQEVRPHVGMSEEGLDDVLDLISDAVVEKLKP